MTQREPLSERHRAMLEFERSWWNHDEPREVQMRARFQCSADDYYAELNRVLEMPAALAHDPLVVRRLGRLRDRRRRARLDHSPATVDQGGAHA